MATCKKAVHVACANPNGLWNSTNCPSNPLNRTLLSFTAAQKNQIVDLHNKWRSFVAQGLNPKFKKAAKMGQMVSQNITFYSH